MREVLTLDCTLRDGGYCNKWHFKKENIKKIIAGLLNANVEIIECGFLSNKVVYNPEESIFTSVEQLGDFLPMSRGSNKFVLMMNYGQYDVELLPLCKNAPIDGIRVAFHKKNMHKAIDVCKEIKKKGFQVYVQPMVSMSYSDGEFIELIELVNELNPQAFYIVDSFGSMDEKSLNHYLKLVLKNLKKGIYLGFHAHNNLQSAFSNARTLIEQMNMPNLIVDCSIYGMGRGAGNLNAELFLNELNKHEGKNYDIKPILKLMDEVINRFYEERPWGYTLPNYLSAVHMTHPNYAGYLSDMNTLKVDDIDEIFSQMEDEKRLEYDEDYINQLYIQYMSAGDVRNERLSEISKAVANRKILLIAPGKKAITEKDKVIRFVEEEKPLIISINHDYPVVTPDYIFVSNKRRFSQIPDELLYKTITTSNIKTQDTFASVDYYKLINTIETVKDNAALMAMKFAITELKVKELYMAGLDGYTNNVYENFENRDMTIYGSEEFFERTNDGIRRFISEYKEKVRIRFVTSSYIDL
ncbi:MAG: aldolase catalytic domain-containing protein [Acetatifactor sp.]|nr:aldolase catalytic domain-containing protein [Acetatifactor sp.]